MECPVCGHAESRVTDTRKKRPFIRRRRACTNCGHIFTTTEAVGTPPDQPALSHEDKRLIRRAIDKILAALAIPPSK